MKKKQKLILIIIGVLLLIGGAVTAVILLTGGDNETIKEEEKKEEVAKDITIVDVNSTTRPYAIMINNHSDARPYHSGLQDAYIVYEIVVEGGITRYMALFKDQETARIHGIRSSRHYYLDYAMENDAIYIHWGGSPQAFSDLRTLDIDSREVANNNGAYYDNSLPVASEHTTYTSMDYLNEVVAKKNFREETNKDLLFNYVAEPINMVFLEDSFLANSIDITYSSSYITNFDYDEENNTYLKSHKDKAHIDYVTGEQYTFDNIITYQVENSTIPGESTRQEIDNIGTGEGYYITGGYAVPIKWSKTSRESQTIYTYLNGEEIDVNDGNTYIAIQPLGNTLTIK